MNAPSPPRPGHPIPVDPAGLARSATTIGSPALGRSATPGAAGASASIHDIRKATRKMRSWYESLADYMVVHPTVTNDELARHFGRAASTISLVVNTDSFKMYFRQRRAQHESALDATVRDKLFRIADQSLDHMLTALEKKRDNVPLETLQRTSDMALKNLGYGASTPSGVTVNVASVPPTVNVAVSLEDLERAREALRRNQLAPPIEAEYTEIESAPLGRSATNTAGEPLASGAAAEPRPKLEDLA